MLLRVSSFQVLIGDQEVGFAHVSRLSSETLFDDQPAGQPGRPPAGGRRDPSQAGTHRFATVVLRRALSTSTDLYDWRRQIIAGKDDRRDVTIRQLSAPGGKVVNAWRLVRAWPVKWEGPEFDALHDAVAVEALELAFDDLIWTQHEPTVPGG